MFKPIEYRFFNRIQHVFQLPKFEIFQMNPTEHEPNLLIFIFQYFEKINIKQLVTVLECKPLSTGTIMDVTCYKIRSHMRDVNYNNNDLRSYIDLMVDVFSYKVNLIIDISIENAIESIIDIVDSFKTK